MTSSTKKNKDGVIYERSLQCLPTFMVEAKSRVSGLELKETPEHFVTTIGDWVFGGAIEEDLQKPEPDVELGEDDYSDEEGLSEEEDEGILVTDE